MSDYTKSPCFKSSEKHLYRRKIHTSINSWPWSLQINEKWAHDMVTWHCQLIPCFDRCQLTIAWMFNIKNTRCKPRLQDLVLTRVRPPCCSTSSLGAHARNPFLPWEKSCSGFYFYACMWSFSYRRFHGRGRHLGSGANATKFTVNVWMNRDFDAR